MTNAPADPVRQELSAGRGLTTSVEVTRSRARYEVRTADPLYQERLEHMGYRRRGRERFVRDLSARGDVLAIHANFARHLGEMLRQSARTTPVRWEQALEEFLERVDGSIRRVVDFPAPLGPRNPVTVPEASVNDTPSTASTSPYRFVSPRTDTTASPEPFTCAGPVSAFVSTGPLTPVAPRCPQTGRQVQPVWGACGARAGTVTDAHATPANARRHAPVPAGRPLPGGSSSLR